MDWSTISRILTILCFAKTVHSRSVRKSQNVPNFQRELQLSPEFNVEWEVFLEDNQIAFTVRAKAIGWVGFGLSNTPERKRPSDAIIGGVMDGGAYFSDYHFASSILPFVDQSQDWFQTEISESEGNTTLSFWRKFDTEDEGYDVIIKDEELYVTWAYHPTDDTISLANKHSITERGTFQVNLLEPPPTEPPTTTTEPTTSPTTTPSTTTPPTTTTEPTTTPPTTTTEPTTTPPTTTTEPTTTPPTTTTEPTTTPPTTTTEPTTTPPTTTPPTTTTEPTTTPPTTTPPTTTTEPTTTPPTTTPPTTTTEPTTTPPTTTPPTTTTEPTTTPPTTTPPTTTTEPTTTPPTTTTEPTTTPPTTTPPTTTTEPTTTPPTTTPPTTTTEPTTTPPTTTPPTTTTEPPTTPPTTTPPTTTTEPTTTPPTTTEPTTTLPTTTTEPTTTPPTTTTKQPSTETPPPGPSFRGEEDLSPEYNVVWEVYLEENKILFTVTVKATGWIGFGISNTEKKAQSDAIIGGIKDGQQYLADYHFSFGTTPIQDASQDWSPIDIAESDGTTTLSFWRKFDTGDEEDDIVIKDVELFMLWAFHPTEDSISLTNKHLTTQRGAFRVNLLQDPGVKI